MGFGVATVHKYDKNEKIQAAVWIFLDLYRSSLQKLMQDNIEAFLRTS